MASRPRELDADILASAGRMLVAKAAFEEQATQPFHTAMQRFLTSDPVANLATLSPGELASRWDRTFASFLERFPELAPSLSRMQNDVYYSLLDHTPDTFSAALATNSVRTSRGQQFSSESVQALYEQGFSAKRWVAVIDDVTRHSHFEANGQTVPLASPFEVGFSFMQYPGDPVAPPSETYNCRCSLVGA